GGRWRLATSAVADRQERPQSAMHQSQCSSSVAPMSEPQCNRRVFTASMAGLVLCPASLDFAHAQRLQRSALKLGVANKAHLYYLPVKIAERRGQFPDYRLAGTVSDCAGRGPA